MKYTELHTIRQYKYCRKVLHTCNTTRNSYCYHCTSYKMKTTKMAPRRLHLEDCTSRLHEEIAQNFFFLYKKKKKCYIWRLARWRKPLDPSGTGRLSSKTNWETFGWKPNPSARITRWSVLRKIKKSFKKNLKQNKKEEVAQVFIQDGPPYYRDHTEDTMGSFRRNQWHTHDPADDQRTGKGQRNWRRMRCTDPINRITYMRRLSEDRKKIGVTPGTHRTRTQNQDETTGTTFSLMEATWVLNQCGMRRSGQRNATDTGKGHLLEKPEDNCNF